MGISCSSPTESSASIGRLKKERCGGTRKAERNESATSSSGVDVRVTPKVLPQSIDSNFQNDEHSLAPNDAIIVPDRESGLKTPDSPDVRSLVPSITSMTMECASAGTTPRRAKKETSELQFIPEPVYRLLKGHVENHSDVKPRVITLYVVACGSDSISERTIVENKIYPTLRNYCAKNNYCLELLDNNWSTSCHVTQIRRMLSKQLLQDCMDTSSLVLVLIFLNNKIEYSVPSEISSVDFEDILSRLESNSEEYSLIKSSYTKVDTETFKLSTCGDCCRTKPNNECNRIEQLLATFQQTMTEVQTEQYLLSAQEDEIMATLTSDTIQPSHVIMVNRNFVRCQDNTTSKYFNLNEGEMDKHSQTKIHQLKEFVESVIPGTNVVRHSLKWKSVERDLNEAIEDREYLDRFTTDVESLARQIISEHLDSEDKSTYNKYTGINERLYNELLQQQRLCQSFSNEVNSSVITKLSSYLLDDAARHPIVLHGPPGCGKSSVIAKMATESSRLLPEAAILMRFCGMTPYSCDMFSVFHSLIQQVDYLNECSFNPFKEELPRRPFPICSKKAAFQTLLDLAKDNQPLVILLDHVTADTGNWFPKLLPLHVKMIITVHGKEIVERIQTEFCEEDCFVELPGYCGEDSKFMRAMSNPLICDSPDDNLQDHSDVSDDETNAENIRTISERFFTLVEGQFGQELVTRVMSLLGTVRDGLTSSAITDLLADVKSLTSSGADDAVVAHFARSIWQGVRCCMLPFLTGCHHKGTIVYMWTSDSLKTLARERYVSSAEDVASAHKLLCDYLVKQWNESYENSTIFSDSKPAVIKPPHLLHELPYHSILSAKNKDRKLLDSFIFNPAWLAVSINTTSTVHVCQVLKFVQTENDGDDSLDLETVIQVVWLSHQALDMDGSQIYSQLIIRLRSVMQDAKRLPKIAKLFNICRSSKVPYMVPSKLCLARDIKEADRLAECSGEAPCNLYLIRPGGQHIASLFEEKGEIVIWDLNSGEQVKTLSNLNHPRALSMIDETRAVILCDRELKVYDLEQDQAIRNLRGVLNLKMPLFSVPNTESVVALSRNRMYINVLDIASGEMVATFKAGEDRFLNSLLVSKNGNVLVCGDATQKPSPLLVWNLKESRLVHDLRMAQHEFITTIADVTSDGHYVVCACVELESDNPNFLAVYDLISGQLFKVMKTSRNTTCLSTNVQLRCVVSGLETGDFLVWDLVSGHNKFYVRGVGSCCNSLVLASGSPVCITYYVGMNKNPEARTVCLWDYQKGYLLTSFTFDSSLTCAVLSPDGFKVIVGLQGYEDIIVLRLAAKAHQAESPAAGASTSDR